jgi:hypothetical protein
MLRARTISAQGHDVRGCCHAGRETNNHEGQNGIPFNLP